MFYYVVSAGSHARAMLHVGSESAWFSQETRSTSRLLDVDTREGPCLARYTRFLLLARSRSHTAYPLTHRPPLYLSLSRPPLPLSLSLTAHTRVGALPQGEGSRARTDLHASWTAWVPADRLWCVLCVPSVKCGTFAPGCRAHGTVNCDRWVTEMLTSHLGRREEGGAPVVLPRNMPYLFSRFCGMYNCVCVAF